MNLRSITGTFPADDYVAFNGGPGLQGGLRPDERRESVASVIDGEYETSCSSGNTSMGVSPSPNCKEQDKFPTSLLGI